MKEIQRHFLSKQFKMNKTNLAQIREDSSEKPIN